MDGTMLAVVEDAGTEAWLDQALQGLGRLEKVTRSDLGRVLRMLEATGASVALVEMTDRDATQSMAVINAHRRPGNRTAVHAIRCAGLCDRGQRRR